MDDKTVYLIEGAVAIILLIAGLVIALWNGHAHWKGNQVRGWPKARGRVISALVKPVGSPTGTEYLRPSQIRPVVGSETSYIPRVTYTYNVSGKQYRNDDIMYHGPDSYTDVEVDTYLGRLERDSPVVVYYDPDDPSDSYLYTGEVDWWPMWVAGILVLIALAVGGHAIYRHRKSSKKESLGSYQMDVRDYNATAALQQRGGAPDMY